MTFSGTQENIEKLVQSVADDLNYIIYESSVLIKGENSKLIIRIDRPDGIKHLDCDIFSKEISRRMDQENILPNYSLEVSSPGLNRKIRSLDEFKRFKGNKAKVVFNDAGNKSVFKGIINNIIDTKIELKSDDSNIIIIDFTEIVKANLEY